MKYKQYPVPNTYKPTICRIAQHEIGHYIIARELGFKTDSVSLMAIDFLGAHTAGSEVMLATGLSKVDDIAEYSMNRVTVLYAGSLAESLSHGNIDNDAAKCSAESGGGKNDYDKARELIQLIRNIRYPATQTENIIQEELFKISDELWGRATTMVKDDYEIIEGLGSTLAEKVKYTGKIYEMSAAEINSLSVIQERFQ